MRALAIGLLACTLIGLAGCTSAPLTMNKLDPKDYDVIGPGVGSSTGFMLFGCIPIVQNDRFVKAYQEAVESKKGDALIDIEIQERWFWTPGGDGFITDIKGKVVKMKAKEMPKEPAK